MLVRDFFALRAPPKAEAAVEVDLPRRLKPDQGPARSAILRRLSATPRFALGARAGALKAAARRGGRGFRLDVRQRVIVKALVVRHGAARGAAFARHLGYLGRSGAGADGERAAFFDRDGEVLDARAASADWAGDRHHFRFIVSPEHGDRIADLPAYVREVMGQAARDLGEPRLSWIATCHYDTDQPHAHVVVRGRRGDGRDLVIPRAYIAYGLRARAQEAAQARLGDLSRHEAERRVWRETQADRFTGLDRRLVEAARRDGLVDDGIGANSAWAALTRGRLAHLERLGLAERVGRRFRLADDLAARLTSLQVSRDVIRTLNQRRLQGAAEVQVLSRPRVQGRVVAAGAHDELGKTPFVIVRDAQGVEHYARLAAGAAPPQVGAQASLARSDRGVVLGAGRGLPDLGL